MAKGNRLCSLQMGVTGHNGVAVLGGFAQKLRNDIQNPMDDFFRFVPQVHPGIEGYLIIAATGSMELFADVSQTGGQLLFNEHVNILTGKIKRQLPALQILQNIRQTCNQHL